MENAHKRLMDLYGSAYACHKATGIAYHNCKLWWRKRCFTSPEFWVKLAENDTHRLAALARDYRAAHPKMKENGDD